MTDQTAHDRAVAEEAAAQEYAAAIYAEATDWPERNRAIIDRWSVTALRRIKRRAWRLHALHAALEAE